MGYYVRYTLRNVSITPGQEGLALNAINALHSDENLLRYASGKMWASSMECLPVAQRKWYSGVENPASGGFTDLVYALDAWCFDAQQTRGYVTVCALLREKIGDEEVLFFALAPFVWSGASIEAEGEGHQQWRYEFRGGALFVCFHGTRYRVIQPLGHRLPGQMSGLVHETG